VNSEAEKPSLTDEERERQQEASMYYAAAFWLRYAANEFSPLTPAKLRTLARWLARKSDSLQSKPQ
jgi:hypothetical protein